MEIIVTNNPYVRDFLQNNYLEKHYTLYWIQGFTENVLIKVRDLCHANHQLLTHPLTGSIKPNQTPYKTVVVQKTVNINNIDSIIIAEESLKKTIDLLNQKKRPQNFDLFLDDFAIIDLDFLKSYFQGVN